MKTKAIDVLIVGSGAGAGPIAYRLASAGIGVCILEKGDWCERNELVEDELAQIQLEMYRPTAEEDPTVVKSRGKPVSEASRVGQAFYLVGGGTVRYSGTSWRLRKDDFRKLSKYGSVSGSTLQDWPLSYEELEPFYTEAEREIGISGKSGVDPTEPARSQNFLMPPMAEDRFQQRLTKAAKGLGWHPFPIPIALHSKACTQCGWCSGFPCLFNAKSSVDIVLYPKAKKSAKFNLIPNAYVTAIRRDRKNKIQGVEYLDIKTGKNFRMDCKVLVLAASAIQSTRLLLHSGLANSSGLLGKNLMFHIEAKAGAVFDEEFHQGLYKKVGVHDFYFPQKGDNFINHRSIQSGSKATPIAFAFSKKGYGREYVKELQGKFLHTHELQCMAEDLPQLENEVRLAQKTDPWGIPVAEVDHKYHEQDRQAVSSALEKIKQLLEAAGGKEVELPKVHENITGRYTWHLMGTARMGKDPKLSVLNPFCQSHDISNLFINDGSSFVTSGGLNPTLTIQALAFRTAKYILDQRQKGTI